MTQCAITVKRVLKQRPISYMSVAGMLHSEILLNCFTVMNYIITSMPMTNKSMIA